MHGTSLNRNKGNSGRIETGRSEENIEAVAQQLENNPHVSSRRNGLGLPSASFNRITRLDLIKMASLSKKRSTRVKRQ